jgi:hypothetical protein
LYTSASKPRTVLPLTETETGTETETVNRNRKAPDGAPDVFPEGLDVRSWERWLAYRKEIGKSLKPASIPSAQQALVKYGDQQAAVVEQSIANGWQGLFALKAGQAGGAVNKQAAVEQRNQAAVDEWLAQQGATHESN